MPVRITGRVLGRSTPGYAFDPDMVVQDSSGFVPAIYLQPLPFWRTAFALFKAGKFEDQDVRVDGWYHRENGPWIELRTMTAVDGTRARSWMWAGRLGLAALVMLAGCILYLATG